MRKSCLAFLILALLAAAEVPKLPQHPVTVDTRVATNYYYADIQKVLAALPQYRKEYDLDQISEWMNHIHNDIKYRDPGYDRADFTGGGAIRPRMPDVLLKSKNGMDCKEKALLLFYKLQDPEAAIVYGKLDLDSTRGHAWVYYYYDNEWWILDPTNHNQAIREKTLHNKEYFPIFSFTKANVFKHVSRATAPKEQWPDLDKEN